MIQKVPAEKIKKILKTIAIGKKPATTFKRLAATVLLCVFVFKFLLIPARINGKSMEPAYRNGSFTFIYALAYIRGEPRRGDVVSIKLAGESVMLLKRIIGLPGEKLSFQGGKLIINGNHFLEPYVKTECGWNIPEVKIGGNEYFAAGDNRQMPMENHVMGRVNRRRITGRAIF
jgi:signal peptidase I